MRKTKKQLLGLAGLAVVGIMTAVAYAMPAPGAAAEEVAVAGDEEPATDDTGVNVQVVIPEMARTVRAMHPLDGDQIVDPEITVEYYYEDTTEVVTTLEYTDGNGVQQSVDVDVYRPTDQSGTRTFRINLASYADYEDINGHNFQLKFVAKGNGGAPAEDTVTFTYAASATTVNPTPGENGDPIVDIEVNDQVKCVEVQAYDKNGNPVFVDKDGNETPITLCGDAIDPETGKVTVELPFEDYGVQPGDYTIITIAKDKDGKTVSMNTATVKYSPNTPNLPNTGMVGNNEFNITRLDFILTGLIAFAVVAGFAIALVFRNSRR